jgi:hypothetical protein
VSAQVIAALRRRSRALEDEYKQHVERSVRSGSTAPGGEELLWLANEFRKLADEAEGYETEARP